MIEDETPIYLNKLAAEQFVTFQKYFNNFNKMVAAGLFDVKGGSAIIDFNQEGEVNNIKVVKSYHF